MKKNMMFCLLLFVLSAQALLAQTIQSPNIILITTDGLRWQEVFNGIDTTLIEDEDLTNYVQYKGNNPIESREKLMPFFWNFLVHQGQLHGNRKYGNRMDTKNYHRFSYPGYSEMLCGFFDPKVNSNSKVLNKNTSVLEVMNFTGEYANSVSVFSSWEVFPYILNGPRSNLMINAGWQQVNSGIVSDKMRLLNKGNLNPPAWKGETRYDDLTWNMALEYLKSNHPKCMFISLDDTDHFGHKSDYNGYLTAIHQFDAYLQEIWEFIEQDPVYKNNTYVLVTTDHGRGTTKNSWAKHGLLPYTSGEIWMFELGPTIPALGELKTKVQRHQASVALKIASYSNVSFRDYVKAPTAIQTLSWNDDNMLNTESNVKRNPVP